jgi:hypothetical protein
VREEVLTKVLESRAGPQRPRMQTEKKNGTASLGNVLLKMH